MPKVGFFDKWKILTKWAFGWRSLFVTTATIKAKTTPTQSAIAQTGQCSPTSLLLSEKNQTLTLQVQHLALSAAAQGLNKNVAYLEIMRWPIMKKKILCIHFNTPTNNILFGIRRFSLKIVATELGKNIFQTQNDSTEKSLFSIKTLQNYCLKILYA